MLYRCRANHQHPADAAAAGQHLRSADGWERVHKPHIVGENSSSPRRVEYHAAHLKWIQWNFEEIIQRQFALFQQTQLISFEGKTFSRRRLAVDPFKSIGVDHNLFIEGAKARQHLSYSIHLIRFEKTVGIEELLFEREQFGRDIRRGNDANSR